MAFVFELPEEFKALYGVRAEAFDLKKNARSQLGSKFWAQDQYNRWYFMPVTLGGVRLHNPVIRAQTRKTIVETPMVERDGSVKEIISNEDFIFNIRGIIKRPDGLYPEQELTELVNLFKQNSSHDIDCALANILLVGRDESVVMTNFSLPERPGQTESVMYELELVSDTDFDLEIDE